MFAPHKNQATVTGVPTIFLTQQAHADMWALVDEVDAEVSWFGTVLPKGKHDFIIDKIFLVKQEVTATTTDMVTAGLEDLYHELMKQEGGQAIYDSMRFWGHSHVNMETTASGTDDTQMKDFGESGCEYFIRGIFNKRRKAQFDVYYYNLGFTFNDVSWEVLQPHIPERRDFWKNQIKDLVTRRSYTHAGLPGVTPGGVGGAGGYAGGYGGKAYDYPIEGGADFQHGNKRGGRRSYKGGNGGKNLIIDVSGD